MFGLVARGGKGGIAATALAKGMPVKEEVESEELKDGACFTSGLGGSGVFGTIIGEVLRAVGLETGSLTLRGEEEPFTGGSETDGAPDDSD